MSQGSGKRDYKKRVGVIATEATINSHLYRELIQQIDPEITVVGKPCPLFVPLVEEGWRKDPVTEIVARRYLKEMQDEKNIWKKDNKKSGYVFAQFAAHIRGYTHSYCHHDGSSVDPL